jgi:hypothetical protein
MNMEELQRAHPVHIVQRTLHDCKVAVLEPRRASSGGPVSPVSPSHQLQIYTYNSETGRYQLSTTVAPSWTTLRRQWFGVAGKRLRKERLHLFVRDTQCAHSRCLGVQGNQLCKHPSHKWTRLPQLVVTPTTAAPRPPKRRAAPTEAPEEAALFGKVLDLLKQVQQDTVKQCLEAYNVVTTRKRGRLTPQERDDPASFPDWTDAVLSDLAVKRLKAK